MTGSRRLSIAGLVAMLVAGCIDSGIPTASTAGLGSPPDPSLLSSPGPTAAPRQTPDPSCPTTLDSAEPLTYLYGSDGMFDTGLRMTAISRVSDPSVALPVPTTTRDPLPLVMIGGRDVTLDIGYNERSWEGQTRITALRATLVISGEAPVPLPVRYEAREAGTWVLAVVTVPDIDGTGRLDVDVDWNDPCFVMAGTVSTTLRVYDSVSVATCATDEQGAFAELRDLFGPPVEIGPKHADVNLVGWLPTGKVTPLPVIDPIPPYVGFKAGTLVLASAPGGRIRVSDPSSARVLRVKATGSVVYYRRGPLLRWVGAGWIFGDEPEAKVVFRETLIEEPDGTFSFKAPTEPARYGVQVLFDYDSACSFGVAGFVVGIDVAE